VANQIPGSPVARSLHPGGLPHPVHGETVAAVESRISPLRVEIAEVLRAAGRKHSRKMGGRAVIAIVTPRVGALHLEAVREAAVQLQRQTVIERSAPWHEADYGGGVEPAGQPFATVARAFLDVGQGK